ncbi:helix-turn-helix protein [Xenorhabdus ehlersii]|uniref:Helix-turn-helix protein n=1 Tax=Xenorhabdus ehlersii TaxID=290111 RepID=A0A2D0IPR9_9GAMM|nr:transcriptional regulator [Xenorhabdus ehlersii]RKE89249.1 helix-turn-helix protein [Xenorhabdus ehlersii]
MLVTRPEMLLNIHLAELRERMNLTQGDIAVALGIKQPTVSDMEKPWPRLEVIFSQTLRGSIRWQVTYRRRVTRRHTLRLCNLI